MSGTRQIVVNINDATTTVEDSVTTPEVPNEALARQTVAAAERGDQVAFRACAERLGSLEQAQTLVRSRGVLRMVDRGVTFGPGIEQRSSEPTEARADAPTDDTPAGPVMFGHFSMFNNFYEVNSLWEGNFLERVAPGAFKKTIKENGANVRALFQHGADPQIGDKPLGPIRTLQEDDEGAYYEVDLLDTPNVREVQAGLEADLYRSSFRFSTIREDWNEEPDASDGNQRGLPERTLKEVRLYEFGPVTFPANPAATAAVRNADDGHEQTPPVTEGAELDSETHPVPARRGASTHTLGTKKEAPSWRL